MIDKDEDLKILERLRLLTVEARKSKGWVVLLSPAVASLAFTTMIVILGGWAILGIPQSLISGVTVGQVILNATFPVIILAAIAMGYIPLVSAIQKSAPGGATPSEGFMAGLLLVTSSFGFILVLLYFYIHIVNILLIFVDGNSATQLQIVGTIVSVVSASFMIYWSSPDPLLFKNLVRYTGISTIALAIHTLMIGGAQVSFHVRAMQEATALKLLQGIVQLGLPILLIVAIMMLVRKDNAKSIGRGIGLVALWFVGVVMYKKMTAGIELGAKKISELAENTDGIGFSKLGDIDIASLLEKIGLLELSPGKFLAIAMAIIAVVYAVKALKGAKK